jgi:phytol kinase
VIMPSPWFGVILVPVILTLSIVISAALRRWSLISAELARKGVHVVLGLTVTSFPWLFTEQWPVRLLGGAALLALAALRWVPLLRARFGGALHGVERESFGEFYLPIAVMVIWAMVPGDWIRYSLPLAILATADAVAALIGKRYGQISYSNAGASKSWEGSLAFAAATFLVVHVPLLLCAAVTREQSLLIAVNMAVLLMLVEGLAWEGFDNLFIPIVAMLLIDDWLIQSITQLLYCTMAIVLIAVGCWWWRRRTTLDDAAILTCAMLGYAFWYDGGWVWLIAPVTLFLVYGVLVPAQDRLRNHRAIIPLTILLPGLVWLLLSQRKPGQEIYMLAAAGTFATQLTVICMLHRANRYTTEGVVRILLRTWPIAALLTILPTAIVVGRWGIRPAGLAALGSLLGAFLAWHLVPDRRALPMDDRRWWRQTLASFLGSLLVLAKHLLP